VRGLSLRSRGGVLVKETFTGEDAALTYGVLTYGARVA
jgi:hypothetical protein